MYHGIRIDRPSFVPFVPAVPVVRNVRAVDACEYTEALEPAMLGVFLPRVDMLETLPESLSLYLFSALLSIGRTRDGRPSCVIFFVFQDRKPGTQPGVCHGMGVCGVSMDIHCKEAVAFHEWLARCGSLECPPHRLQIHVRGSLYMPHACCSHTWL